MSSPGERTPSPSNYFCHNCGTINTNPNLCNQCQSEFLEEMPPQTLDIEQMSNNDDQQIPLIHEFQNLFNNGLNIQTFTNMLLPMLMSQTQSDLPQHRHRRGRPPRRIKRITHSSHRYLPFQSIHTPIPQVELFNFNELVSGQAFNTQLQPNMAFVQVPLQLLVFDPNEENFNSEMLTQLLNEDTGSLPVTRDEINQLPSLTMTPSTLSVNPSCAICLENFEALSEVKQLPTCHHVFHTNCLTEWLLRHGNCPMCRSAIPSIQRTPTPIFNDHWMQQLFFRTFRQQQQIDIPSTNTIVPYPPIKTINPSQILSNTIVSDHPSADVTPQLPRFDSQTQVHNTDSSSNIE